MFAQLGSIVFDLLTSPLSLESASKFEYAEHKVIEGKPKLQFTGEALDDISLDVGWHSAFCDPDSEYSNLLSAAREHQALELILGSGESKGSFVITDLSASTKTADQYGASVHLTAKLKLKQFKGTSTANSQGEAVSAVSAISVSLSSLASNLGLESLSTAAAQGLNSALDSLGLNASQLGSALSVVSKLSELGSLSVSDLASGLSACAQAASNLGVSGTSGLASLGSGLLMAGESGFANPGQAMSGYLSALGSQAYAQGLGQLGLSSSSLASAGDALSAASQLNSQAKQLGANLESLLGDAQSASLADTLISNEQLRANAANLASQASGLSGQATQSLKNVLRIA